MSPAAVTQRLRTMDELWVLSVKLMNSKPIAVMPVEERKARAFEIQDSIRQVLFKNWDPIGVNNNLNLEDEYDSYIGPVYRLLSNNVSEEDLIEYLYRTERDAIGLHCESPEELRPVAQALLSLSINLE